MYNRLKIECLIYISQLIKSSGKAQSQVSTNPSGLTTPTNLIYSSDTVIVKVVKLTGIKIVVPGKRLVAGEEVG